MGTQSVKMSGSLIIGPSFGILSNFNKFLNLTIFSFIIFYLFDAYSFLMKDRNAVALDMRGDEWEAGGRQGGELYSGYSMSVQKSIFQ